MNTLVHLSAMYCTPIPRATIHSVTDRRTDDRMMPIADHTVQCAAVRSAKNSLGCREMRRAVNIRRRYCTHASCSAQNPLHTFPLFPVDDELPTCFQPVGNLAPSRCNGIWETTRHNGHNGLFSTANLKIRRQSPKSDCRRIFKLAVEKVIVSVVSCRRFRGLSSNLATNCRQCA